MIRFFEQFEKSKRPNIWVVRRKWRTRNIEMSKYLHLLSCNYLKNIVKNFKLKNKYVKIDYIKVSMAPLWIGHVPLFKWLVT